MLTTRQLASEDVLDHPPNFLLDNIVYEAYVGSQSYGVSTEDSDTDIEGICIPPKPIVFPHLAGEIPGFGRQKQRFRQYQQQGQVWDTEFDLTIYSLPYFFQKAMNNEPKFLDLLYAPNPCVSNASPVSALIRHASDMFLHKGSWHKFRGFSYQQRSKMAKKEDRDDARRYKYGYHAVRLLDQGVQVLEEGTLVLDPPERRERMRAIREGEWTFDEIEAYCEEREERGNMLYEESEAVPHSPDEQSIRYLLLDCLEEHWGSIEDCVAR